MIRIIKMSLSLGLAILLLAFSGIGALAESEIDSEQKIFFEVPENWNDYESIYCYTNVYGSTDALVNWHADITLCTKVSERLYSYDLSKVCKIESTEYYVLIFSDDKNNLTFDVLLSVDSIGDTVIWNGDIIESPNGSTYYVACWKNTIPTLFGDTNLDRALNIKDATYIQKYLAKIEIRAEQFESILDTNQDGRITIADATFVQKHLAKIAV